ncbi:chitin synthase-domain-containing protein [Lactarius hengduanensis]|nr:chitin synthase-domain-containing protein [Lactarius hengduanensis]
MTFNIGSIWQQHLNKVDTWLTKCGPPGPPVRGSSDNWQYSELSKTDDNEQIKTASESRKRHRILLFRHALPSQITATPTLRRLCPFIPFHHRRRRHFYNNRMSPSRNASFSAFLYRLSTTFPPLHNQPCADAFHWQHEDEGDFPLLRVPSARSQESISLNTPGQHNVPPDDDTNNKIRYDRTPQRVPRRNKTSKRVELFHGNFVLDSAVPTKLLALSAIPAIGAYQEGIATNVVNSKLISAHILLRLIPRETVAIMESNKIKGAGKGIVPVQIAVCLKEKNQTKINSHRCSISHLWKAFNISSNIGGACGEIVAFKGIYGQTQLNPPESQCWVDDDDDEIEECLPPQMSGSEMAKR